MSYSDVEKNNDGLEKSVTGYKILLTRGMPET